MIIAINIACQSNTMARLWYTVVEKCLVCLSRAKTGVGNGSEERGAVISDHSTPHDSLGILEFAIQLPWRQRGYRVDLSRGRQRGLLSRRSRGRTPDPWPCMPRFLGWSGGGV